MTSQLLPTRFLFRFAAPCLYDPTLGAKAPSELETPYRLPILGELEGQTAIADVRAAWSESGLGFTYFVFDRELGQQYFSMGSEFPFASDPSLWGTLELVK